MRIEILETSITNRQQYDISDLCKGISWFTSTEYQPGKLQFDFLDNSTVYLREGDEVEMRIEGQNVFKGKVFKRKRKMGANGFWSITAYDKTRYLKNEDTLLFNVNSVTDRFKRICEVQGLPYKVLDKATYNCTAVVEDKHTYYSMLKDAIEETRKGSGQRFAFWDNFGTLEIFNLNRQITKLVIGDESLMTDYEYELSIDDAANSVKVLREDKEKGKREIYVEKDNKNIEKWGKLQIVETISDADLNTSQLKQRNRELLKEYNKPTITTSVKALSNLEIRAGKLFTWRNSDLTRDNVNGVKIGDETLVLVTQCTHSFDDTAMMDLEIEVIA